jgi:hypothetical protein
MILSGKTKEFKGTTKFVVFPPTHFNPILHATWLDNHALTLKRILQNISLEKNPVFCVPS